MSNHDGIIQFTYHRVGEVGRQLYLAELAITYAKSNEDFIVPVDVYLQHVMVVLLNGVDDSADITTTIATKAGTGKLQEAWAAYVHKGTGHTYFWKYKTCDVVYTAPTRQLNTCLVYLRDIIGVPRDMNLPAAMQL